MSDDIKRMSIREFRELGFLQEANRLFFHPRGLALEVKPGENGDDVLWGVWDYRNDPEGIAFVDGPSVAKAMEVDAEFQRHSAARFKLFGDTIQPTAVGLPKTSDDDQGTESRS